MAVFLKMFLRPEKVVRVRLGVLCIGKRALGDGRRGLDPIKNQGLESDASSSSLLLNLYVKCGRVAEAGRLFEQMPKKDLVSWNKMLHGHVQLGNLEEALRLFEMMQQEGLSPDRVTVAELLSVCTRVGAVGDGKRIHEFIKKRGFELDNFVGNNLVTMYAKCGRIGDAQEVFDQMQVRDVVAWTALIGGYVKEGVREEAHKLFEEMQEDGVRPNRVTFINLLSACLGEADLENGRRIHSLIVKAGVESRESVGNALIDMYGNCGSVVAARQAFDKLLKKDFVSWTTIVGVYARHGFSEQAIYFFDEMQLRGFKPGKIAIMAVLKACGSSGALEQGRRIHAVITQKACESDIYVTNVLIDMYLKCGGMEDAQAVFHGVPERDVVSWNTMITGCCRLGHGQDVLNLYSKMQTEGVEESEVTFMGVLRACTILSRLEEVRQVHASIVKAGFEDNVGVMTSLLDTYAKCGSIEDARKVFNAMKTKSLVSWNAMSLGYAQHGRAREALALFQQMQHEDVKPDGSTFVSLLSACSHGGLVDLGHAYFLSLTEEHGIVPQMEHYACMVDLFGRAGHLDEALDLITKMPFEANDVVWRGLLAACTTHCNVELGNYAAERALELQRDDPAVYALLSNLYASAGRLDEVWRVRKLIREASLQKEPARSWIEVDNLVHSFFAHDNSHPHVTDTYAELERVIVGLKDADYVPHPPSLLQAMCED